MCVVPGDHVATGRRRTADGDTTRPVDVDPLPVWRRGSPKLRADEVADDLCVRPGLADCNPGVVPADNRQTLDGDVRRVDVKANAILPGVAADHDDAGLVF